VYGQSSSITSAYFLDLCKEHLEQKDFERLASCSLNPFPVIEPLENTSAFLDSWRNWEQAIRLHLAKFRAQNLKRDFSSIEEPSSDFLDAASIAKTAVTMDSPLEAEMYLDKARWDYIDSLEGLDHFSDNVLYAYLLKLYLIERNAQFKEDEGFAEYKRLYASIINNASGAENRDEANSISNESGEPK
jgi:hypothetical protein